MGQSLTAGAALVFISACLLDPEKKGIKYLWTTTYKINKVVHQTTSLVQQRNKSYLDFC